MSKTVLKVDAVLDAAGQINSAKSSAASAKSSFSNTGASVDGKIKNRSNIRNRIRTVQNQLSSIDSKIGRIRSTVQFGVSQYQNTDNRVEKQRKQIKTKLSAKAPSVSSGKWAEYFKDKIDAEIVKSNSEQLNQERADNSVLPGHILKNAKIISDTDFTSNFLSGQCNWFDMLACAWDSNWLQNALSLFGIGENMNEKAVRNSIETLIKNTLKNKYKSAGSMDGFTVSLTAKEFENFKKVVDYIDAQKDFLSKDEIAQLLGMDAQEIQECEYLDFLCDQTELSSIEFLSKGLGAVENIEVASQMIGRLLNDYSKDLELLENIRTAMKESGYNQKVVDETINTIERNYKNQATSAMLIGLEKVCEESVDAALEEALPLLNLFTAAKDFGCVISDLGDKTENLEMIYTTNHYSYALNDRYNYYADIIRSGEYTQADVDQCNIYFELARNAKIQEYGAMINLYESALKDAGDSKWTGDFNQLKWQGGVLNNGVYSFASEEDKQAAHNAIAELEFEIDRLEGLDGGSSIGGGNGAGGGGGAGGR